MDSDSRMNWLAANQRALLWEFADLKRRLGADAKSDAAHVGRTDREHDPSVIAAVDRLAQAFGLTSFERGIVLLCAGVEMDSSLASACTAALGLDRPANPTFGLALAVLDEPHWSALTPNGPLRRWRLAEVEAGTTLATSALRIDERILHFLAGLNALDRRLATIVRYREPTTDLPQSHTVPAGAIESLLRSCATSAPLVQLCGDDPDGKEDVAARVAANLGLALYVIQSSDIPTVPAEVEQFHILWSREAALLPAALLIQCEETQPPRALLRLLERQGGLVFLAGRDPLRPRRRSAVFEVNKPAPLDQVGLWKAALGPAAGKLNGALDTLALQFRLSAQSIRAAGSEIVTRLGEDVTAEDLAWQACKSMGRHRLDDLAQRIEGRARWEDLILPGSELEILHQIAAQVRHRMKVYETWGFASKGARGLGISALFVGESGTGKTLAAEVLARDLDLDLYRIDLSSVVSKYIGETEKNLKRVFDAAEDSGSVLLFDEADALFGKRSEVKDSHDRYANIEVGYLLQRIESYRGLAILTTNLRSALDKSFQRRLRFIVQFPFPDAEQREAIWRRAFPSVVPTEGLNHRKLAQAQLAGGSIRNVALNAAFLAAEEGSPVRMGHVLSAGRSEALKTERPLSDSETRGWV
jgi:ATPase family protein associated with various cellular activities (AAA)/winged helix domain-containing protein